MALAPPKSGLFVQLPRTGVPSTPESGGGGGGGGSVTPVPIYCSATMLVNMQFPAVTQHQVVLRLGTTMSMSLAMAADASAAPALPDPGIGNALLVDTLGNYLVDTNGDYLYGKEP